MRLDHLLSKEHYLNYPPRRGFYGVVGLVVDGPNVVMPPLLNRSGNTPPVIDTGNTSS